ncbi:MAG: L-lactate dehydrogenase [Pirellulales bacterium]|nr:L-lactate dehydrogenase [Pirellulales bacterium]
MERVKNWTPRKVVVVGAGAVGSTFAYALAQTGLADEIALIDKDRQFAEGQVLDLSHGQPFFPAVKIHIGDDQDYADAQVIVMTAGAKQRPGQNRLDLLHENVRIVKGVVAEIVGRNSDAVLLVVTNPVDVLTYFAAKQCGWERGRVLGSGTVLDTARLRHILARRLQIAVHNVHAYVLGEHGDSEFVPWSLAHVAGMSIDDHCPVCGMCECREETRDAIEKEVRDSAYHIIDYKGATHFGVGLSLVRIVGSILRNEQNVLPVSTMLDGEYGLHNVCLSVPCILSDNGVERVLESKLSEQEQQLLLRSADVLRKSIQEVDRRP